MRSGSGTALLVIAVMAAILQVLLQGCAGAPEVRESRRPTAVHVLRATADAVEAIAPLCPAPVPACPVVQSVGLELSEGLRATADAIERGGEPADVGVCLAPLVGRWLLAGVEARLDLPEWVPIGLELALGYLPDCDG